MADDSFNNPPRDLIKCPIDCTWFFAHVHCKGDGAVLSLRDADIVRCADCVAHLCQSCSISGRCRECDHAAQERIFELHLVELSLSHALEDLRTSRNRLNTADREQLARLVPLIRSLCDEGDSYTRTLAVRISEAYAVPLPGLAA